MKGGISNDIKNIKKELKLGKYIVVERRKMPKTFLTENLFIRDKFC